MPAEERDYVRAIHAEPDPRRKLAIYAHGRDRDSAASGPALRGLARGRPRRARSWRRCGPRSPSAGRAICACFVADVAAAGGLRTGVSVDDAADLVWATNAPEFYLLLVGERGWDTARFGAWLGELWTRTLLP